MNRKSALRPKGLTALGLAGLTLAGAGGCSDFQSDFQEMVAKARPQRTDLIVTGRVKGQAVSGPGVEVSLPNVFRENDDLVVTGTVTRRPGFDADVPGFLDLQILGPDGQGIDESLIHWDPGQIPTSGTRSARYSARILGYPPAGSVVKVAYVEKAGDLRSFGGTEGGGGRGAGGARGPSRAGHR